MEYRYHLYQNEAWMVVLGGHYGLDEPVCHLFQTFHYLEVDFCIQALQEALEVGTPKIFNSDQGSQFTSLTFLKHLEERNIQISMDGRGRAMDNTFTERLWRSLKYEEVYINDYESVRDAKEGIARYMRFYNQERPH